MPKSYSAGGRVLHGAAGGGGGDHPPGAKSWTERFGALRNLPPFLKLIWTTSPTVTTADLLLRLVRALLPVVTLYIGKLIIDEVILLAGSGRLQADVSTWFAGGQLDRLAMLLLLELGLAILADVQIGRASCRERVEISVGGVSGNNREEER